MWMYIFFMLLEIFVNFTGGGNMGALSEHLHASGLSTLPWQPTLWLQAGAREDDAIHLPSGLDHVDCERHEEEEEEEDVLVFVSQKQPKQKNNECTLPRRISKVKHIELFCVVHNQKSGNTD